MTADMEEIKRLGLDKLRFGDLVLLQDHNNTYGTGYLGGAVTIGVIVHSDCVKSGHGPGVTVIMSSAKGKIEGIIDSNANIGYYMNNKETNMKDTKKYYDYIEKLIENTPDFMIINDDEKYVLLDRLVVDLSENAMPWLFKVYLEQKL